jgi:hypothetical protein
MPPETRAATRLDTAMAAARDGDFPTARALAEAQISAFPDEPAVLHTAGDTMRQCGDRRALLSGLDFLGCVSPHPGLYNDPRAWLLPDAGTTG